MRMNWLYRLLRRQHRDVGVTPELRKVMKDYVEGYAGTYDLYPVVPRPHCGCGDVGNEPCPRHG